MLKSEMLKLSDGDIGLQQVQDVFRDWNEAVPLFVLLLLGTELLLRTFEWWTAKQEGVDRRLLSQDFVVNMLTSSVYNLTVRGVSIAAILGAGMLGYNLSHWRIPLNWWTLPAYFLASEFWLYFFHRLMHDVRFFWADHTVHHSSVEYDFSTFERKQWLDWLPKIVVIVPLAMMGFHPAVILLFSALASIQLIVHTSRFGRWGWWDLCIISPATHAVHHARNPLYMDKNHGGVTYIWDHIFGTFQNVTGERLIYGVTHGVTSNNIFKVFFWEYTFLVRDFIHAPTLKDKVIVLFGRPGETFEAPPKAPKARQVQTAADIADLTPSNAELLA